MNQRREKSGYAQQVLIGVQIDDSLMAELNNARAFIWPLRLLQRTAEDPLQY